MVIREVDSVVDDLPFELFSSLISTTPAVTSSCISFARRQSCSLVSKNRDDMWRFSMLSFLETKTSSSFAAYFILIGIFLDKKSKLFFKTPCLGGGSGGLRWAGGGRL